MSREGCERLAALLGVPVAFVAELCDAGIVEPADVAGEVVAEAVVERVRVSWTLHDELGVNLAGVEVALNLLEIIARDRRLLIDGDGGVR